MFSCSLYASRTKSPCLSYWPDEWWFDDGSQLPGLNETKGFLWRITRNALHTILSSWNAAKSIVLLTKVDDMTLGMSSVIWISKYMGCNDCHGHLSMNWNIPLPFSVRRLVLQVTNSVLDPDDRLQTTHWTNNFYLRHVYGGPLAIRSIFCTGRSQSLTCTLLWAAKPTDAGTLAKGANSFC